MSADDYLDSILATYQVDTDAAKAEANRLYPTVERWAGKYLQGAFFSGSIAKDTNVRLSTDADVFVSLSPDRPGTLRDIYESLHSALTKAGYSCRRQNVPIRVRSAGAHSGSLTFLPSSPVASRATR